MRSRLRNTDLPKRASRKRSQERCSRKVPLKPTFCTPREPPKATPSKSGWGAEATGLAAKAEAMAALDEASRGHEEYRMRLDNEKLLGLESIRAREQVARQQAKLLGTAFENAKIDIVGGDQAFIDRIVNSVSMGKSVDSFVGRSETVEGVLKEYLNGDKNLLKDLKGTLAGGSEAVQNLTLSALLLQLMDKSDGDGKGKLQKLLGQAKAIGVENLPLS